MTVNRWARRGLEALALFAAVGFVVSTTFIPHLDTQRDETEGYALVELGTAYKEWLVDGTREIYPFPVHVDENRDWVVFASVQRHEDLRYPDPYRGNPAADGEFSLLGSIHKQGYHLGVAQFQQITGLDWLTLFKYMPALWAGLVAALVWAGLRPWPGAPVVAALFGLMPTTVRFLGPGFLVAISFGLAWLGALFMLLPSAGRSGKLTMLTLLMLVWGFFIHVIVGFVGLFLLLAAVPFAFRSGRRTLLALTSTALLPMIWLYEAFFDELLSEVRVLQELPIDFTIFDQVGLPFLFAWVPATAWMVLSPPRDRHVRVVVQAATLLSVALMVILQSNFHFGNRLALYDRYHQPWVMAAAFPIAHLLVSITRGGTRLLFDHLPSRLAGLGRPTAAVVVGLSLFVGLTGSGLTSQLKTPYYHVLEEEDWERFTWVQQNVDEPYDTFLSHPWKAPVLTAMSGMRPVTWLTPGTPPHNGEAYTAYLSGRSNDAAWMVEREVSLVVDDRLPSQNPYYTAVGPGTALLNETVAKQLREIQTIRMGTR